MNRPIYLISFLETSFERDDLTDFLTRQSGIDNWFYSLPFSVFVESNSLNAHQISRLIEGRFGEFRHLVTRVDEDFYGRMPQEHWDMF